MSQFQTSIDNKLTQFYKTVPSCLLVYKIKLTERNIFSALEKDWVKDGGPGTLGNS